MTNKKQDVKITKPAAKKSGEIGRKKGGLSQEIEDTFSRVLQNWPFTARHWHLPDVDPFGKFEFPTPFSKGMTLPRTDFSEADGGYELTAEFPGMGEDDVECTLTGNTLTVKGEKQEEKEEKKKGYHLKERHYGSFERRFTVPDDVDIDKLEASVSKGVLKVTMPKKTGGRKAKKINVKSA